MDVEKEIDRLYGLPSEKFTGARDTLAKKLRKDGAKDDADRVKSLRKPTAAAAIANRLARDERMNVRALLAAGERLRDAQAGLLKGGDADRVRKAAEDERKAVAALLEAARREGAQDATLRRVETTLRAAAIDEEGRDLLARGRLTKELEAVGFGLEGMPVPKRPPKRSLAKVDREAQRRERALERARKELEAAKQRSADAADALERAQEHVRELERSSK
jgi:hypothetical protein